MSPVSSRTISRSSPATTSGLSVDAAASSGYSSAGAGWRTGRAPCAIARMPCSGRSARGSVSYRGPPTAPNRIASARCASASVASGSGCAGRVVAGAADRRRLVRRRGRPSARSASSTRTRLARRFPGRCRRRARIGDLHGIAPACAAQRLGSATAPRLEASRIFVARAGSVRPISSRPFSRQCLRNGSTSNVNVERAVRRRHASARSRSIVSLNPGNAATSSNSRSTSRLGQHDRQQAVLEAVVEEDVARYDGAMTARKP